jgi:recombination protein RecA
MPTTSTIRTQIEVALAHKIPAALTPAPKMIRPMAETGIEDLDNLLQGGLPIGAVSELVGPESSGRTDIALSFVAHLTQASKVCAWIDASNSFDPVSAAAVGVDLARLLWVRCGVVGETVKRPTRSFVLPDKYLVPRSAKQGLHGGGFGSHPRGEAKGLPSAVSALLNPQPFASRCEEPQRRVREERPSFIGSDGPAVFASRHYSQTSKPWARIEQALRAADLLLQGGGFSAVVLDMASLAPEFIHASSSRPGFVIERQRSERNPALFSSRSMRVQRVAPNYFFTSSLQKLSAMKPPYLQGYNPMLRSLGDVSRRTQAMSFCCASHRKRSAELPGGVEPHGQVRDDKANGTLCVSICERISSAIAFTASSRAAQ